MSKKSPSATRRGKRKGIAIVPPQPDERIEIRFKALEEGAVHGPAWDAMWDMLIKKFMPYALAIAEQEQKSFVA